MNVMVLLRTGYGFHPWDSCPCRKLKLEHIEAYCAVESLAFILTAD
jgi:hypothetical protein